MPDIGDVSYDEAGFQHQVETHALWRLTEDPDRKERLLRESETIHEFYRQFPGIRIIEEGDDGKQDG